jgi:hypothetical protein
MAQEVGARDDRYVTAMLDVSDPGAELAWLDNRPDIEAVTGYDASGWEASVWVLHAMYENPSLPSDVSYHDRRQRSIEHGAIEPLIVGDVNLDGQTTVTGTALGFVVRPGSEWRRLYWRDSAARVGQTVGAREQCPPGSRWFPSGSWPISIDPPPEGSLDETSLDAIIRVLAAHSADGLDTRCVALYGSLAASDFDRRTVLAGPLGSVPNLVQDGSRFRSTPSNIWPMDRSWFVWTDWDLWGTKVSGSQELIAAINAESELETIDWTCEPQR